MQNQTKREISTQFYAQLYAERRTVKNEQLSMLETGFAWVRAIRLSGAWYPHGHELTLEIRSDLRFAPRAEGKQVVALSCESVESHSDPWAAVALHRLVCNSTFTSFISERSSSRGHHRVPARHKAESS